MFTFNLGIDVSKAKLDCALRLANGKLRHKVLANSRDGFEALHAWLSHQGVEKFTDNDHFRIGADVS